MKKSIVLTVIAACILSFQNCSPVSFAVPEDTVEKGSLSDTTIVDTKMNTPVTFVLEHRQAIAVGSIKVEVISAAFNGTFEVVNLQDIQLKYTPNFGFRGQENARVIVTDKYSNSVTLYLIVNVGNSLSDFEPALAIRGMGCIQCHATIKSNIVTDFGYGNDYFFGVKPQTSWWQAGGIYGDHGQNFGSMDIPADKTIVVPKANVPAVVSTATGKSTVAAYVKDKLEKSSIVNTKSVSVAEKNTVYIGAPTGAQIEAATHIAAGERYKYYKNGANSLALAGVVDQGTFFEASGRVDCDGDLVLRGPLYIENMILNTNTGCRLYVIGSVFMYGTLDYRSSSATNNLQISSSKSINLGLGLTTGSDGKYCDTKDPYATDPANYNVSSLVNRHSTFWTVPGNFVRQAATPKDFGDSVIAESKLIEAKKGKLMDAICRTEKRAVGFEHLLLNAPVVHSRYQGDIKGTVIAEFSVMSLGAFKFEFDPVFKTVPVWPFLDPTLYLHIE